MKRRRNVSQPCWTLPQRLRHFLDGFLKEASAIATPAAAQLRHVIFQHIAQAMLLLAVYNLPLARTMVNDGTMVLGRVPHLRTSHCSLRTPGMIRTEGHVHACTKFID
jgi:hypothetical protein